MKKNLLNLIIILILVLKSNYAFPQISSENGYDLPVNTQVGGPFKVLLVFAEVQNNATNNCPAKPTAEWTPGQLPTTAGQFFDAALPASGLQGYITKYFYDASFGQYVVLGDYVNQVIQVPCSNYTAPAVLAQLDIMANNGTLTFGSTASLADFDRYNMSSTAHGTPKPPFANNGIDAVIICYRNNPSKPCGSGSGCVHWGYPNGTVGSYGVDVGCDFGICGELVSGANFIIQEFFHGMFGGNNWHTGAGAGYHTFPFLNSPWGICTQSGISNVVSGWDRNHLGWIGWADLNKTQQKNNLISAIDFSSNTEVSTDLSIPFASSTNTYILRDFVNYGDAIRIKLPHINCVNLGDVKNQYLWIENHQLQTYFDHGFWENEICKDKLTAGMYACIQVGKNIKEPGNFDVFPPELLTVVNQPNALGSFLFPLTAEGNYDFKYGTPFQDQTWAPCAWLNKTVPINKYHAETTPNPLTGFSDLYDFYNYDGNDKLQWGNSALDNYQPGLSEMDVSGNVFFNAHYRGDSQDAFSFTNGNTKISVASNPSSSPVYTYLSGLATTYNTNPNQPNESYENRTIWLNGISVEILNENVNPALYGSGAIKVKVRFNDYDIDRDVRWCGNIKLSPHDFNNTQPSLNVLSGKTILLDQGRSFTHENATGTDANGNFIFALPTLMTLLPQSFLNLNTNSSLIVDNNSTLRLEANSRLDIANGATLRVRRGGKLELLSNCTINVADGGKIIIEEEAGTNNDGILMFYPNARINLNGTTALLEIAGNLSIQDNATFTVVSGSSAVNTWGSVKFSSTDAISQNVAAGANCKFILQSNTKARKILYVNQESLYGPDNLTEFTLRRGTAIMAANSRIVAPVSNSCVINFDNAQLTTNNNLRNNHRGLRLNGQQQVTLLNSTFAKGSYGVYAYNTTLGNSLFMTNCSYIDCNNGLYSYDKSVNMTGSHFLSCGYGWYGEQMSLTSSFTQSSATYNTTAGIYYQGVSILNVDDPLIDYNSTGIVAKQAAVYVNCGSVSNNSKCGFHIVNNATLFMNTASSVAHSPVAAVNNDVTVLCAKANNLYFNLGYNNLKPIATGLQKTLSGTFKCQTYGSQAANKNNWNGTLNPLAASEYNITTSCSAPANVIFTDPVPIAAVQCGQAIPPCNPPCNLNQMDPLKYCPSCDVINTDDYSNEKLNDASEDAKSMADNDAYTDNEKIALDKYNQILMESIPNPDNTENYILNYDYERMKQSFIDAYNKGQLLPISDPSPDDTYMQKLLEVQDKIITSATVNGLYDVKLFVSLDKAQTYRIAGKISASILLLNEMLSWAAPDEYDYVDYILCLTKIERDVLDGTMSQDDVEFEIINCTPALLRIANSSTSTPDLKIKTPPFSQEPNVFPNPANDFISIKGYNDALCTYSMTDVVGKQLLKETFKVYTDLPIDGFKSGIYFYTITSTDGKIKTGKLIKE